MVLAINPDAYPILVTGTKRVREIVLPDIASMRIYDDQPGGHYDYILDQENALMSAGLLLGSGGRLVLSWYALATGKQIGTLRLPLGASPELSVGNSAIVFRVGRSIRVVDVHTKRIRTVAKAAGTPIGLSIAGNRVAWAENVAGRGRIRAITLAP